MGDSHHKATWRCLSFWLKNHKISFRKAEIQNFPRLRRIEIPPLKQASDWQSSSLPVLQRRQQRRCRQRRWRPTSGTSDFYLFTEIFLVFGGVYSCFSHMSGTECREV